MLGGRTNPSEKHDGRPRRAMFSTGLSTGWELLAPARRRGPSGSLFVVVLPDESECCGECPITLVPVIDVVAHPDVAVMLNGDLGVMAAPEADVHCHMAVVDPCGGDAAAE